MCSCCHHFCLCAESYGYIASLIVVSQVLLRLKVSHDDSSVRQMVAMLLGRWAAAPPRYDGARRRAQNSPHPHAVKPSRVPPGYSYVPLFDVRVLLRFSDGTCVL